MMMRPFLLIATLGGSLSAFGVLLTARIASSSQAEAIQARVEAQAVAIAEHGDTIPDYVRALAQSQSVLDACTRSAPGSLIVMLREEGRPLQATGSILAWPGASDGIFRVAVNPPEHCALEHSVEAIGVVRTYSGGQFMVAQLAERDPSLRQAALLIAVCLVVLNVGLAYVLGRRAEQSQVARIGRLTRVLDAIETSGFTVRAEPDGRGAAFDLLVNHVNAMIARMGDLTGNLSRLTLHIAHDLRSPLEILQRHLRRLHQQMGDSDIGSEMSEAREKVTALMARCEQLLAIARIETTSTASFTSVPLREQLSMLIEDMFLDHSISCNVSLDLEAPMELNVPGQPEMIQRMFTNLLQNALKFAKPGTAILVRLTRDGVMACVRISNTGPIVSGDRLDQIFDPHVATSVTSGGGYGLGLPFVRAAARRHGGEAYAEPTADGMCMVVRLPIGRDPIVS